MLKRQGFISIFLFFLLSANCLSLSSANQEQLTKLLLREIGNDFLLALKDSTSRILPVESTAANYTVRFERDLSFNPEVLINLAQNKLTAADSSRNWLIQVKTCDSLKVVHSFQVNTVVAFKEVACSLRKLPLACYLFSFTDLSAKAEQVQLQANSTFKKSDSKEKNIPWIWMITILIAVLIGLAFIARKLKSKGTLEQEIHLKKIGKFNFDEHKMTLTIDKQTVELSGKESELLSLLYSNKNQTLERDKILSAVWGDEGDYVGRTLDVFISKLRKKLAFDQDIEIVNIRGIGYRLVVG